MTPVPRSMAVLATIPGREDALAECLQSLRPQVEQLRVVCHDMTEPPPSVRRLADLYVCEPDVAGSAAGIRWSQEHEGLYLKCDDDLLYPEDYVATMLRWVRRWKGRALVTAHGRILTPGATEFTDAKQWWTPRGETPAEGTWLNYPGGCALAFDTRVHVPTTVPGKNLEEAHLAVWGQRRKVPMFLVPHAADWLTWLLTTAEPSIWVAEKASGFAKRNAVLAQHKLWRVYHA